jgi:hypothetical protein
MKRNFAGKSYHMEIFVSTDEWQQHHTTKQHLPQNNTIPQNNIIPQNNTTPYHKKQNFSICIKQKLEHIFKHQISTDCLFVFCFFAI